MIGQEYDSKKRLAKIPVIFDQKFPEGFVNDVAHWGNFKEEELHQKTEEGIMKLKHLDIDFGNACSLRCPHCFRRDARLDCAGEGGFLSEDELIHHLKQAKKLGLETVKFLGRGEPFENARFLGFLMKLKEMGIRSSVFTKGHVLGSDELARRYNMAYGINSADELIRKLKELDVSILLGFNSFKKATQEEYAGIDKSELKDYVELRDRALIKLIEAGFNKYEPGKPTRLAMIAAPVKPETVKEIFDIYEWGRRRNIYVLSCPSTVSGKGIDETERVKKYAEYLDDLKEMYIRTYIWNIEHGLMTLEQFKKEKVGLYPGCHPCNQVAAGMYMTLSGKIIRCPGRADAQSTFCEDIRKEKDIKDVWARSENHRRAEGKGFNYRCPARDGHSIIPGFYKAVEEKVLEHFEK
jgi:MoaA/NifB/PqqE/SkfB family radical SAM enzyme